VDATRDPSTAQTDSRKRESDYFAQDDNVVRSQDDKVVRSEDDEVVRSQDEQGREKKVNGGN
jgi:hypothetical protein